MKRKSRPMEGFSQLPFVKMGHIGQISCVFINNKRHRKAEENEKKLEKRVMLFIIICLLFYGRKNDCRKTGSQGGQYDAKWEACHCD